MFVRLGRVVRACRAKGSAAALICELLGGALAGGAVLDKHGARNWGNLLIAVSPSLLGSGDAFRQKVTGLAEAVRTARPLQPGQPVQVPGDGSSRRAGDPWAWIPGFNCGALLALQ